MEISDMEERLKSVDLGERKKERRTHITISTFPTVWECFREIALREGSTGSEELTKLMADYVKKHLKSNNPQSLIDTYSEKHMMAIPHMLITLELGGQAKVRKTCQATPTPGLKDMETAIHDWMFEIRKELNRR